MKNWMIIWIILMLVGGTLHSQEDFNADIDKLILLPYEDGMDQLNFLVNSYPLNPIHLIKRARFQMHHGKQYDAMHDIEQAQRLSPFLAELYLYDHPLHRKKLLAIDPLDALMMMTIDERLDYYVRKLEEEYGQGRMTGDELNALQSAINLILRGELEEAMTLLHHDSSNQMVWHLDLQGVVQTELGFLSQADDLFANATAIDPNQAIVWYNWSRLKKMQEDDDAYRNMLNQSLELDPNLNKAYFEKAQLLKKDWNWQDAIDEYDKIIANSEVLSAKALVNRGMLHKIAGQYNEAMEDLNQAIQYYPQEADLYKNRGNLELINGEYEEAIRDYTEAIYINPEYAEAYYNRGIAYLLLYRFNQAIADFTLSEQLGSQKAKMTIMEIGNIITP